MTTSIPKWVLHERLSESDVRVVPREGGWDVVVVLDGGYTRRDIADLIAADWRRVVFASFPPPIPRRNDQ